MKKRSGKPSSLKRIRIEDQRTRMRVLVALLHHVVQKCIHQVNDLQTAPQPPSWFGTAINTPNMTDMDLQLIRVFIEEAISEFQCPPREEEQWLTTQQTRKALSISAPTLRGMRRRGEICSMRVGQAYRYQLP